MTTEQEEHVMSNAAQKVALVEGVLSSNPQITREQKAALQELKAALQTNVKPDTHRFGALLQELGVSADSRIAILGNPTLTAPAAVTTKPENIGYIQDPKE